MADTEARKVDSFYLDTQMYDYLVFEKPDQADRLLNAINAEECRVFGSIELLEEFAGLARKEEKLQRVLRLFWEIIRWNVLGYAAELVERELAKGSRLSIAQACIPRQETGELRSRGCRCELLGSAAPEVKGAKNKYARVNQEFEDKFVSAIQAEAGANPIKLREFQKVLTTHPIDEQDLDSWLELWFGEKLGTSRRRALRELPCVRATVAISVARIYRRHGIPPTPAQPSDLYDNHHYVFAAFAGRLVTRDKRFLATIQRIKWKPVPVLTADQFCRLVDQF